VELLRWCRLQWDRVLAVGAFAGGVLALVLGWVGASGTEFVAKQVPYVLSGGLGGLVLLMVGGTLWLSADFRDEWRALDRLEAWLSADVGESWRALDRLEQRLSLLESGAWDELQRHREQAHVLASLSAPGPAPAPPSEPTAGAGSAQGAAPHRSAGLHRGMES